MIVRPTPRRMREPVPASARPRAEASDYSRVSG